MPAIFLGIDVAKATFDVALLHAGAMPKHRAFKNDAEGFAALSRWLAQQFAPCVHACLEATGPYGEGLARYLVQEGHTVSIVNPSIIPAFAKTQLSRTKTDKADAARIARYCQMHQPPAWTPPSEEVATLQALVRRLEALQQMCQMETNRLEGASSSVQPSIHAVLATLEEQVEAVKRQIRQHVDRHPSLKEQHDLLVSIPGIGEATAAQLLAELNAAAFTRAGQAAAFVGLAPRQRISGSSVRARSSLFLSMQDGPFSSSQGPLLPCDGCATVQPAGARVGGAACGVGQEQDGHPRGGDAQAGASGLWGAPIPKAV